MSRANDVQGFVYDYPPNREQVFWNDVGYFPDGTGFHNAGNAIFREEKDLHKDGSALPASKYVNDVGYFPDGTAYNNQVTQSLPRRWHLILTRMDRLYRHQST